MTVEDIEKNKCSGCAYCADICPKSAITMKLDENGDIFPYVNDNCIDCGLCFKECAFKGAHELSMPMATYVGCRPEKDRIMDSSSGGVFAAITEKLLQSSDWVVCGCILDDKLKAIHVLSSDVNDIRKMYGSKYVQSCIDGIYKKVNMELKKGKKVLFSGTPCQIDAVKKITGSHPNLYTIEIICHGVTSPRMFDSYMELIGKDNIERFVFRDKKQGWSFNNKVVFKNGKEKRINHRLSSYMTYYLNGDTYRDACYNCPFAIEERGADITIGDFWGVVREKQNKWEGIDAEKGVSCILVNTEKGEEMLKKASITRFSVPYDSIKKGNEPLNHPSKYSERRKEVLAAWEKRHNWKDVDELFRKKDYSSIFFIWSLVPVSIQHFVRVILKKR